MGTPRSTRREFLQGKAAADVIAQLEVGGELPAPVADSYLVEYARRAMACRFAVFLNAGQYPQGGAAALASLDLIDQLEDQLSIYRPESELSRLNRLAPFADVEVEPRLFALFEEALAMHRETGGAFDVTAGQLSRVWGFTARRGKIPEEDELQAALECVGSGHLILDSQARTVRFARPGLEINLGSIGKGYALDRQGELLRAEGVNSFLLHGGNSSVLARGSHGAIDREGGQGWLIGVRNARQPRQRLGSLRLVDRALATSGSGTQFFEHGGRRFGHILDPRSGWPAEGVLSVTVLAPTAAWADAVATACYVMGPAGTADYCARHPEVSVLMQCPAERAGGLAIELFGMREGDWLPRGRADAE